MKNFVALALLAVFALSGCLGSAFEVSKSHVESSSSVPTPTEPDLSQPSLALGLELYSTKKCADCHGADVAKSAKLGMTLERLDWSLANGNVPAMSSIRLSQLEKQSLVLALSPSSSPSGPLALKRTGRTHGRRYLLSVLRDVFRSSRFESERFEGLVQPLATSPSVFGTPCNVYSTHSGDDCGSEILTNTAAPLFTQPTTVRNLAQIEVCERLTSDSAALLAAIDNVGGVGADRKVAPLTADKLEAIQLLFDPDRRPTREEKAIAEELLKRLAVPTVNEIDRWRLLIQLSCEQPGWTVL